ncbi:MAG: hypothetical protein GX549_00815 [Clostridiales bacterium]|nr:hypothetical protein [Clostridiales bacterium]
MAQTRKMASKPYTTKKARKNGSSRTTHHKKRAGGGVSVPLVFLLVVAIGLAAAAGTLWARSFYKTTIIEGVSVNGRDVGGMTREEAYTLLTEDLKPIIERARVRFTYEGREWTMDADDLGLRTDLDAVLGEAAAIGRTGGFAERRKQASEVRSQPVDLPVTLSIDESAVRARIASIAQEIDTPPVDATVTFDPSMEPESMFSIKPDQPGNVTDQNGALQAALADLSDDWQADVALTVSFTDASVTDEHLSQYTSQISYFATTIRQKRDHPRAMNIALALSAFDGLTVYPGETVSFNAMTGERTMAKGYQEAPQIASDKSLEPALGGGVCQASTTLYNAALLAGLEITERNKHSFPSSYVREGFDAAVNWPDKDLKFTNNTDGPIFIKSGIFKDEKDNTLNARVWIYGKPLPDGQYYERDSKEIERLDPPAPEIVPDEKQEYIEFVYYDDEQHVYRDSHGSLKIQTYRVLKDKDGNEISREAMYEDHYRAITGLTYVGIVPAYKRPPDVNHDGIPDVDTDGDGIVDMIDKDGDRVGDIPWTPPKKHDDDSGDDNDDDDD